MKPDLPIDTQILWLAAELVEKGHCKGRFSQCSPSGTERCALGAILFATGQLGIPEDGEHAIRRLLEKVGNILDYNDAPERTAAEVALALRTA